MENKEALEKLIAIKGFCVGIIFDSNLVDKDFNESERVLVAQKIISIINHNFFEDAE